MIRRLASAAALVAALLVGRQAAAWDAFYAVRQDADVAPTLSLGLGATLPLTSSPADANALSLALAGAAGYADDDKLARFVVAGLAGHTVFRAERDRYEPSTSVRLTAFDLDVQLRLLPGLHLLYGAGLMRSGPRAHARLAALCFELGLALPLVGARTSMRDYRRGYLQVEARPLVASLLGYLDLEGATDREEPTPGVGSEVALRGGLATRFGEFDGDVRLTASYTQGSLYAIVTARYLAPVVLWRIAPFAHVQYVWPGRPLRQHISEPGQRLLYHQHLSLVAGLSLRL